ncbi:MAG: metallophosphoesterase [Bacteroidales bacterium]|nr:metallophosphoesterase [Bacteroidales bacterium]
MFRLRIFFFVSGIFLLMAFSGFSQKIPEVYTNLSYDKDGNLQLKLNGKEIPAFRPEKLPGDIILGTRISGDEKGLRFNFSDTAFSGQIAYGFIKYGDSRYPMPVYFKRTAKIKNGVADIPLKSLSGKYDMIGWETTGTGTIGFRVFSKTGVILYDGISGFEYNGKRFDIIPAITEGPFINKLTEKSCVISFRTSLPVAAVVKVDGRNIKEKAEKTNHEILIDGLKPVTKYDYTVVYDRLSQSYSFETALPKGSNQSFTFAYLSDSRGGQGGGERNFYGPNAYIVKKAMALATQEKVKFMQFTGDLITGYGTSAQDMNLQYANWKQTVSPFAHYLPVNTAMGNHETYDFAFYPDSEYYPIAVDHFPFDRASSESIYAANFVNPENGPESEDGSAYDPDSNHTDFPSYKENVYYYIYGNTAIVVLNSNYLYAPFLWKYTQTGGNIHGYIMDNQLKWLKQTLQSLEQDSQIKHVFVTIHTPPFPNGGHSYDDMWYSGDNSHRPVISGKPVAKGIIERRDEFLDIIINQTTKVCALLTGDEHNYNHLLINNDMPRYPEKWNKPKLKLNRSILQINNGAAGAPYYAQEKLPWSANCSGFTTQNALVLITVNGNHVTAVVKNPDTLEEVDKFTIK